MADIRILSGKDQLRFLAKLAVERQYTNESFTDEEISGLFGAIESVFGANQASAVLNLVLDTYRKHKGRMTFNRAVVEAIANHVFEYDA